MRKDDYYSLWSCFRTEDEYDDKPVTLREIREIKRKDFKLYAFLTYELLLRQKGSQSEKDNEKFEDTLNTHNKQVLSDTVAIFDVAETKKSDENYYDDLEEKQTNMPSLGQRRSSKLDNKFVTMKRIQTLDPTSKLPTNYSLDDVPNTKEDNEGQDVYMKEAKYFSSPHLPVNALKLKVNKSEIDEIAQFRTRTTNYSLHKSNEHFDKGIDNVVENSSLHLKEKIPGLKLMYRSTSGIEKLFGTCSKNLASQSFVQDNPDNLYNLSQIHETSNDSDMQRLDDEPIAQSNLGNKRISNKNSSEQSMKDKVNNSSNTSESGYTGSLETVSKSIDEPVSNKHIKLKTASLGRLTTEVPKDLRSKISIASKRAQKSILFSSSHLPVKIYNFEDELNVSELSSSHATLPRRSNSPLPHDRELERERFPINRSGLQGRSESMASVYSGAGEGLRGNVTIRGEVQFSLLYNYRLGALEVGVKRCRDLAPVDVKRNRSDPYVKVYLLPDKSKTGKRKTKIKKNTLNPSFEETLSFVQPLASLSSRTLWLSVWHADIFGRNDFLGEVTLPLADVVFDDPAPMWHKLHERTEQFDEHQGTRGDLIIGLKFEIQDTSRGKGTLHVLVKEAKNLVATKPNGLADVFCKSYLLPERGRLAKQKTGVARRSLSPRWEHSFSYRGLTPEQLAARALELSLWDRDLLASNDFMGAVRLSLGSGTYMGANVNWMDSTGKEVALWQTMLERPNFWVEGSLPLRPQLNN